MSPVPRPCSLCSGPMKMLLCAQLGSSAVITHSFLPQTRVLDALLVPGLPWALGAEESRTHSLSLGNRLRRRSQLGGSGRDRGVPTPACWGRTLGTGQGGEASLQRKPQAQSFRDLSVKVADGPVCGGEGSPGRHSVRHEAEDQLWMGLCCLPPAPGLSAGLLAAHVP